MTVQVLTASVLTDGSGDFTVTMPCGGGVVQQVRYVVDGGDPLATGADLTITEGKSGINLLTMADIGTSSFTRLPRKFVANPLTGVESTTNVDTIAVHGSVTLTIAQGGAAKLGTFFVYVQE